MTDRDNLMRETRPSLSRCRCQTSEGVDPQCRQRETTALLADFVVELSSLMGNCPRTPDVDLGRCSTSTGPALERGRPKTTLPPR